MKPSLSSLVDLFHPREDVGILLGCTPRMWALWILKAYLHFFLNVGCIMYLLVCSGDVSGSMASSKRQMEIKGLKRK
jgi:hypothetical protein